MTHSADNLIAADITAGFADDDWGSFDGSCDVCNAQNVRLCRTIAYGIETFYCQSCGED